MRSRRLGGLGEGIGDAVSETRRSRGGDRGCGPGDSEVLGRGSGMRPVAPEGATAVNATIEALEQEKAR